MAQHSEDQVEVRPLAKVNPVCHPLVCERNVQCVGRAWRHGQDEETEAWNLSTRTASGPGYLSLMQKVGELATIGGLRTEDTKQSLNLSSELIIIFLHFSQ